MERFLKILLKIIKWIFALVVLLIILLVLYFALGYLGFCFDEFRFLTSQDLKDRNYHIRLEKSMASSVNMNKNAPALTFEMLEEYRKKYPNSFYVKRIHKWKTFEKYINSECETFETGMEYFYPPEVVLQNVKDKNLSRSEIVTGAVLVQTYTACGKNLPWEKINGIFSFECLKDKEDNPYRKIIKEKLQREAK